VSDVLTPATEPDDNPENYRQIRLVATWTEDPDGPVISVDVEHRFGPEPNRLETIGLATLVLSGLTHHEEA